MTTCCDRMAYDLSRTCDLHAARAACPDAMIARVKGGFGLYIRDGENGFATSTIEIAYCPWCGTKLPPTEDFDEPLPAEDIAKDREPTSSSAPSGQALP
ncbi:DUF6980 family protein [Brevundimonas sp. Root1279]|uniref:DUF6980 family protein n=1 Tax=Brevundimonas sp. Root1279 TaxID=1736443 RepID=UPI003FA4B917